MSSTEFVLKAEGLCVGYDDRLVVHDLDLAVRGGEIIGLLGPNGAGKTTTLSALVGLRTIAGGTVRIAGAHIARESMQAKAATAFVPDEPPLFDYMTVAEHLEFYARLYSVPRRGQAITVALECGELVEYADAYPETLSRGYRQRVALACAMVHEPRLLLLDEPLTGLDPAALRATRLVLETHAANGAAVVLSSHQLQLVEQLCTRVVMMLGGRLVFDGTVAGLRAFAADLDRIPESRTLEDGFLAIASAHAS